MHLEIRRRVMKAIPGSQVFNASGNFIVPGGYYEVVICMCGGGGAGGGAVGVRGGGGGGSGVIKRKVMVTPSEIIPITISGGQGYTTSAGVPAPSSVFNAASETITAAGGRSSGGGWWNPGIPANGGGAGGGNGSIGTDGKSSSKTCNGTTYQGGIGAVSNTVKLWSGGGAGGFGAGADSFASASPNTGAGGGGSEDFGYGAGGSGKCIVYWGGTHPPFPAPT